jgi:hypothetical protein
MKKIAGKVTIIDDFFGRKQKSSEGKELARLKKQVQKQIDRTPTRYTIYYTMLAL